MKYLLKATLIAFALSFGATAALAEVELPCKEVEDCKPIDPCKIAPERCQPEPAPQPTPAPPLPD